MKTYKIYVEGNEHGTVEAVQPAIAAFKALESKLVGLALNPEARTQRFFVGVVDVETDELSEYHVGLGQGSWADGVVNHFSFYVKKEEW